MALRDEPVTWRMVCRALAILQFLFAALWAEHHHFGETAFIILCCGLVFFVLADF